MKILLKYMLCIFCATAFLISCKKDNTALNSANKAPVANAGPDQIISLPLDSVILDGSSSSDPDGIIRSFRWAKISGPASFSILKGDSSKTLVKNLAMGNYLYELTVTDNKGLTAKDTVQVLVNSSNGSAPCGNRPFINASLVPIGSLSLAGKSLVSATANNKILFAGGIRQTGYSKRVDIYDITTNSWSTAELSQARGAIVAATVGSKIFFAGGEIEPWVYSTPTSRVDIYDASNGSWSTAELTIPRGGIAAATIGNKVFFAGGFSWQNAFAYSNVVDIYDNATSTWSTTSLSEARAGISATVAGDKIYFAGGLRGSNDTKTTTIDIFNASTNSWSTSNLLEAKSDIAGIAAANKIYWAGGINSSGNLSSNVEIRDLISGVSSSNCVIPRLGNSGVKRGDEIVFFTGYEYNHPLEGTRFEIYNLRTDTWSTGVLNQKIFDATLISVNNTIYVAGGTTTFLGAYFNQVWRLDF